jgi:hypothetical protein
MNDSGRPTLGCHSERSEESAFRSGGRLVASYSGEHGGSAGTVEDFGAGAGFSGVVGFAADAGLFCDAALPTVKYLRIFSRRLGPMPRIALRSSTLLNAPYDLRICKIFSAVTGPMPGTNCNSSDVAVFKLTGAAGGFFFAEAQKRNTEDAKRTAQVRATERTTRDHLNMRQTITHPVLIRINNYIGFSPAVCLGRRRLRARRTARLAIRFARGRQPRRFACSLNQDIFARFRGDRLE